MNDEPITNYEDVTVYGLDGDKEQRLIDEQNELTFSWITKDGSPMSVIMSYFRTDDGHFWMTASGQRKRVPAIRRDPRVALVITSPGTSLGPGKTVTYKGTAVVHDAQSPGWDKLKAWSYLALARRIRGRQGDDMVKEFAVMLDSPRRVIIEVTPGLRVGYDGDKMREATIAARRAGVLHLD